MGSFLKEILELTDADRDAFDRPAGMEKPGANPLEGRSSEDAPPSPNVGLPSALVPREPPGPAYVTHTGPLVRLLLVQEGLGRPARSVPAVPVVTAAPRAGPERDTGSAGSRQDSPEPARAPPRVCHRIVFARKPLSNVARSDPERPGRRERPGCS